MAHRADEFENYIYPRLPVIDNTGLTGQYDINFEATTAFRRLSDPQPENISVFTAVQQQLGLKLVPEKASVNLDA